MKYKIKFINQTIFVPLILIVLINLLASCGGRTSQDYTDGDYQLADDLVHLRDGLVAINNRDFKKAETEFKSAIELRPNNAPYYNYLGLTYLLQQKYNESLVQFRKAVEINSNYADAYNNCGNALQALGQYDQALEEFKKALNISDYDTPEIAYYNIGRTYFIREQWTEAAFNFQKAIDVKKKAKQPEALNYLAMSLFNLNKISEALPHLKKAVEYQPKYALAHFNLGKVYYLLGDTDKALPHFLEVQNLVSKKDPLYQENQKYLNKLKISSD